MGEIFSLQNIYLEFVSDMLPTDKDKIELRNEKASWGTIWVDTLWDTDRKRPGNYTNLIYNIHEAL